MVDLRLEVGEGILLQTTDAGRYDGSNEIEMDELYLTNKNLICVYEKSNGFFAKSETVVDKIPLTSIAVINGVVQIEQVDDDDYGKSLQIIYTNGRRELLEINVSPKKQYPIWKNAISDAVLTAYNGGVPVQSAQSINQAVTPPPVQETKKPEKGLGAAAGLFAGFKGVADTVKQSFSEVTDSFKAAPAAQQPVVERQQPVAMPQIPVTEEPRNEIKHTFCSNCGTKLNEGSKFCHGCGAPVNAGPAVPPPVTQTVEATPVVTQPNDYHDERQQKFVGTILKCPNCGAVITGTTAVCPDCGMHITGRHAVSSVQAFKDQLMQIENSRVGGIGGYLLSSSTLVDPADKKKLTLITNFPIPNSVEDIMEFMLLATININVGLSKGKWDKRPPAQETGYTIKRTLSNAWVSKMIQAYQKAEIMFPNDPAFAGIQKIYLDKVKELKIKIN